MTSSHVSRFEAALAAGRREDAEAIARHQLTRGDAQAQAWAASALARCALAAGEVSSLRHWLDRAGRVMKKDPQLRDFQVSLLLEAGDADAALALIERDDAVDPVADSQSGTARILALWQTGRKAEAAALFDRLAVRHGAPPGGLLRRLGESLGLPLPGMMAPARVEGVVEIDDCRVRGWAVNPDDPSAPVEIRLVDIHGNSLVPPQFAGIGEDGRPRTNFAIDLAEQTPPLRGRFAVVAGAAGQPLAGSPIAWPRTAIPRGKAPARRSGKTDIVIPVHGGRTESLACLSQAIETVPPELGQIVVVDDASPDRDLAAALDDLARSNRITLLRNAVNLGFPGAVNRGMALHPDRDVVLLNSDTLVSGDWLGRLREAAYAARDTGTVTPLSNDATICSYPLPGKTPNPVPDIDACESRDGLAAEVNAGLRVDLPTAVGFCMYIRRDCLAETGEFSEELFGRGYGEENDFCRRAAGIGWRHVAACDVFVGHVGSSSFGAARKLLLERNLRVLQREHPGYAALVADFESRDPLAPARRRLDLARWRAESGGGAVLLITLDLDGGVARHVEERAAALCERGKPVLILSPAPSAQGKRRCRLKDSRQPELRDLVFTSETELDLLAGLLAGAGVTEAEIHHSLNHEPAILDLPRRLGIPYTVTLHDYHWICPQVTLIDASGRYCGEPDLAACERCRQVLGNEGGEEIGVADLRRRSTALLTAARQVIAPSRDVAERYRRYMPGLSPLVVPWDDAAPPHSSPYPPSPLVGEGRGEGYRVERAIPGPPITPSPSRKRAPPSPTRGEGVTRICVVGAIGPHKGFEVLKACAEDAAKRNLPLEFILVGHSCDDAALFATGRVFVTGRYDDAEGEALVRAQDAHCAFIPSVWPETWCYALSLAWRAGLRVVSFDLGAQAERIRAADGGAVLPFGMAPAKINDALLEIHVQEGPSMNAVPNMIATPQEMLLPPGFYAITVTKGAAKSYPRQTALPSILVAVPPAAEPRAEILSSHAGGWLTRQGDTVMLKVMQETPVIITSFKDSNDPSDSLEIQFSRVDGVVAAAPAAQTVTPGAEILAHVQALGDQTYEGGDWAGAVGKKLWIEGFSIAPKGGLAAEEIEYKGVTSNGWETPWVSGGALCGTRGQAMPLIGVAIRLKGKAAERYDCVYEAAFVGGGRAGPAKGGTTCRSDVIGAPLEGIRLAFAAKA